MQDRVVLNFKCLEPPPVAAAAAAAADISEPEVGALGSEFVDTMPPPIVEHIMSQLLYECDSPGTVRIVWYIATNTESLTVSAPFVAGRLRNVRLSLLACSWRCCLQHHYGLCSTVASLCAAKRTRCRNACLLRRGTEGGPSQCTGVSCVSCRC